MTHDDLLNYYFPKPNMQIPQYVTPAPPMPQQQDIPAFLTQPAAPPGAMVQQGGGEGGGTGDILSAVTTLVSLFGL